MPTFSPGGWDMRAWTLNGSLQSPALALSSIPFSIPYPYHNYHTNNDSPFYDTTFHNREHHKTHARQQYPGAAHTKGARGPVFIEMGRAAYKGGADYMYAVHMVLGRGCISVYWTALL